MMDIKTVVVATSAILLIVGIATGVFIWSDRPTSLALRPYDAKTVAMGKRIYTESCASCHGINLKGQPNWTDRNSEGKLPAPPHDPSGHTWHHGDKVLFDLTKFGTAKFIDGDYKSDMLPFEGVLSDEEIIAVLSYIKSTWPKEMQKRHDLLNESLRQQESQN
jgi:mono/diheme cytochrome c family protein